MPVSNSRLSYSDCFTLFDKALEDTKGARYQVANGDYGKTKYFIMRMHQARALDRKDNKDLHEPGHPMHGHSIYDTLVCQLKEDSEHKWWVYVSHTEISEAEVESLSEIEAAEDAAE